MKILVLGSQGQLASQFKARFPACEFMGRDDLAYDRIDADVVVNCMAYTAVDKAETHREECDVLNVQHVRRLVDLGRDRGFHLVHFSTDFVFSGNRGAPYRENDETEPLNEYGKSKRRGELEVLERSRSGVVVRTSWLYSRFGANFVKTMLRLPGPIRVVDDQRGCPTYAGDLVMATMSHFASSKGLYHFAGEGSTTWYGFAKEIMRLWHREVVVTPIRAVDFHRAACIPAYSVLSTEKYEADFGEPVREWTEMLRTCREEWELQ